MMPEDQGMVGAFNDKIEFHPEGFTNSRDDLVRSLKDLDFGYPTRLYDAVEPEHGAAEGHSRAARSCSCSPTATTTRARSGRAK